MQSHDAEFSNHGRTVLLPVNDDCNNCGDPIKPTDSWGRDETKLRVHFPRCMPKKFTSEELDNAWKADAKSEAYVAQLEKDYLAAIQKSEALLVALREIGRRRLEGKT